MPSVLVFGHQNMVILVKLFWIVQNYLHNQVSWKGTFRWLAMPIHFFNY